MDVRWDVLYGTCDSNPSQKQHFKLHWSCDKVTAICWARYIAIDVINCLKHYSAWASDHGGAECRRVIFTLHVFSYLWV